jgi:transposase
MAVTIVEEARPITCRTAITGGVDTHADTHVAAALDPVGGLLVREFPATSAGYAGLLGWLGGFGTVALAGIEGTGSYGAGLARHVAAAGIRVVEVDRSDRQDRRRQGKSDPLDAVSAAQSGRARRAPKGRDGAVEAIRALMVARRSAAGERTRTNGQARALLLTGPDDLRARFTRHTPAALVTGLASLRPRPGDVAGYAVRVALRELGRRTQFLDGQLSRLDDLIVPLVTARAPGLLAVYGLGPRTAARLLIAAGDHPGGCAARRPGRTCAASPRSPRHLGKSPATGSTPAVTARPIMPCGGSCSPGWALTRPPAPTLSAAPPKGNPRRRSSAA